jgi:hypothetical protein
VGSALAVSGQVPSYGPDGTFVPPHGQIQVWWNLDPDAWESVAGRPSPYPSPSLPGSVLLLSARDMAGACTYDIEVSVPDVSPGVYPVVIVGAYRGGTGVELGWVTFEVTT